MGSSGAPATPSITAAPAALPLPAAAPTATMTAQRTVLFVACHDFAIACLGLVARIPGAGFHAAGTTPVRVAREGGLTNIREEATENLAVRSPTPSKASTLP